MPEIVVSAKDGSETSISGDISIDPVENSLVITTVGGRVRFYWPNVISVIEVFTDD